MRRLLILACGATKRHDTGLLPAIERYDGPPFRTLRKALAELPASCRPTVLILSAEYGLLAAEAPIPDYNRRMAKGRALSLRPHVGEALAQTLCSVSYDQTLINLGVDYLPALPLDPHTTAKLGAITYAQGGIGARMSQMKYWLLSLPAPISTMPLLLDAAARRRIGREIAAICRSDLFYELLATWGCGAFDGGCLIVADALHQALKGGQVLGLMGRSRGQTNPAVSWQHAVLQIGADLFADGDGLSDERALRGRWQSQEGVTVTGLAPMAPRGEWPTAYPHTPYDPAVVAQLAELFREALL